LREEQPRVDETILSARGDTKLKLKKVLVLFQIRTFYELYGKNNSNYADPSESRCNNIFAILVCACINYQLPKGKIF
jgi:hypothetical protein